MATYTTPGVFVEEISTLPASIAPVATAVPAFIGYTARRVENIQDFDPNNPVNDFDTFTPKRITSFLEYTEMFGPALPEEFGVTLTDSSTGELLPDITVTNPAAFSPYNMYYQVKMYYENGGGACWIVSVGDTSDVTDGIDKDILRQGVDACEKEDEITLLVVPEAVKLTSAAQRKELHDAMLAQCAKLQDRFTVMDVVEIALTSIKDQGDSFRNNNVGLNNLKYGASYFPSLVTTQAYLYDTTDITITDSRTTPLYDTKKVSVLNGGLTAVNASGAITVAIQPTAGDKITIAGEMFTFAADGLGSNILIGADVNATATNIAAKVNAHTTLNLFLDALATTDDVDFDAKGIMAGTAGNGIKITASNTASITGSTVLSGGGDKSDMALYSAILAELKLKTITLYPSASICGVYATVDRTRGVWKAPANFSLNAVEKPNLSISAEDQGLLNVDATSGKSINAIRTFTGKGVLVWGARTLAGNDNEWRYVPVRRLYIFIEESVKKATEFVVFEANDANTWARVKTMITNFLTGLWRDGALAGAKPEDAFFVKCGLGVTMTAVDILEGRMNVEIGMAAVRPAEFIILKFSHMLAKS